MTEKKHAHAKEPQKDNIYVDVDDEITNIIDRVKNSDHKIVALVLPKRATVLQSAVNMKLLKRSADRSKKKLVLITSEAGLLPLAGAAGLHVAKNLQSKPEIPSEPDKSELPESLVHEEELEPDEEPELDDSKSVGELSGDETAAAAASGKLAAEETIQMDDDGPVGKKGKKAKGKKDKKLKVPNFERFRKWLILGGIALIVLLIGGYFALAKMPKAKITIQTDSSDTTANITFNANTTNKTFDLAGKTVPAQLATNKKTDSQSVAATGQKDIGNKATGTVTIKNCEDSEARSLSAGSSFTSSSGGKVFTATSGVVVPGGKFSGGGLICTSNTVTVNVTAAATGDSYNIGPTSYTSAQLPGKFTITGSTMSGGTTNVVKVVAQSDVDGAKQKMTSNNNAEAVKAELKSNLEKDGMFAIDSSFVADGPTITSNPAVGSQADNATVTAATTYTMLGVDKESLKKVIEDNLKGQIDTSKQAIQNDGIDTATFTVTGKENPTVAMQTTATIGPNLDTEAIKREIAGKKKNATKEIIQSRPSIKGVTVNYSPFWVTRTPGNPNKVTIVFEKANNQ